MTKDEIIKLAREAGIDVSLYDMGAASCVFSEGCHGVARDEFQRFAKACYEAGRTAERSACAEVAEVEAWRKKEIGIQEQNRVAHLQAVALSKLSDAIRARGKP